MWIITMPAIRVYLFNQAKIDQVLFSSLDFFPLLAFNELLNLFVQIAPSQFKLQRCYIQPVP